jgi:epoxyqueuosine reductase
MLNHRRPQNDLAAELKAEATRLGFDLVGIAPAISPSGHTQMLNWLESGCAANMSYMTRQADARKHPESLVEGVRTVVMVGFVYGDKTCSTLSDSQAKVAKYAQGTDYHDLLWSRLGELLQWLERTVPGVKGRAVADTAPLMERDFARLAGLGWIGKNTMLISPKVGSFTLLGALLVDIELAADEPFEFDRCGTCTRCLEACPTQAFQGPHRLDARRCISYWTIEHRGEMPDSAAENLHGWVFGCDICQDVCPWNRKAPAGHEPALQAKPEWRDPDLIAWLERDAATWTRLLKGTALKRTKRAGLIRNACLIIGTRRLREALPALEKLQIDPDETIQWAANWAIRKITNE